MEPLGTPIQAQHLGKDLGSLANASCPGLTTARCEQRRQRGTDQQPPPLTGRANVPIGRHAQGDHDGEDAQQL